MIETILIYDIPKKVSTNAIYSWVHWKKRKDLADIYHKLTEKVKTLDKINEKVNIEIQFYFRTRYLDSSNCSYMWKMIEDSLVKNWLLKDDTNEYVWKFTVESMRIDKKERKLIKNDYLRIIITNNKWN